MVLPTDAKMELLVQQANVLFYSYLHHQKCANSLMIKSESWAGFDIRIHDERYLDSSNRKDVRFRIWESNLQSKSGIRIGVPGLWAIFEFQDFEDSNRVHEFRTKIQRMLERTKSFIVVAVWPDPIRICWPMYQSVPPKSWSFPQKSIPILALQPGACQNLLKNADKTIASSIFLLSIFPLDLDQDY